MSAKSSPSIVQRFTGRWGRARLIEAVREQSLVGGDQTIASKLCKNAAPTALKTGCKFITQGAADNDIYFILSGSCSIKVNDREIAIRKQGQHVGEIALLDTTSLRSATVFTTEPTVVLKVSEKKLSLIANKHPEIWRRMAIILSNRLMERNKFHIPPRTEPAIFIGSSSEGLDVAKSINQYLSRLPFVPRLWADGVFECSKTTIESLLSISKEVDFAVLVLTKDDVTKSRGKKNASPRDNVIFELGMFMGALDRARTYIISEVNVDLKIPTDLLGVTFLPYKIIPGKSLVTNLQPVLQKLKKLILKYGPI